MATFKFVDRNDEVSPTTYKQLMVGEGMQSGGIGMNPAWPYGYRGVGTSQSSNQLNGMRVDFEGETNFIAQTGADGSTTATTIFKYPSGYHGKPGYTSMVTKGTDTSYFTHHNSGNEAAHVAACQYQINGLGIPNRSSCFVYPTDEWFTMMVHVKLGARGHGFSSMNVGVGSAPATRQAANQVLLTTSTWVEHFNPAASAGLYIRIRGSATGTVDARVTVKDTTTFTGKTLLTLSGVTGTIQDEALLVDEYENGFVNSTIEYHGANSGGAMQLLHRRTGVVMRVGNYVYDSVGYSPMAKYGTFAWTTFMTRKSLLQTHAVGKIWVSQIIIKSGATPPSTPA